MEAAFLQALYAKPAPVILGRRLRPFSLSHRVALMALGSPFMSGDGNTPIEPADVAIAVAILSMSEPFAPLPKPTLRDRWECRRAMKSGKRHWANCSAITAFIADHSAHPTIWEKKRESHDDGIPWVLHVITRLIKHGIPERDAWTMSEGRAIWLNLAILNQSGADLSLVTDREKALMERIK